MQCANAHEISHWVHIANDTGLPGNLLIRTLSKLAMTFNTQKGV
ncbi:hypothetical protein PJE062_2694 [Pseudovibrio sp. JE062]|nr:hypothetical protein PJE062_2694 [Pseudovibrio sp. JE062]